MYTSLGQIDDGLEGGFHNVEDARETKNGGAANEDFQSGDVVGKKCAAVILLQEVLVTIGSPQIR